MTKLEGVPINQRIPEKTYRRLKILKAYTDKTIKQMIAIAIDKYGRQEMARLKKLRKQNDVGGEGKGSP